MGLSSVFKFFLPKESKFFPLLHAQVNDLQQASELLIDFTREQDHERRKQIYVEIKKVEKHCDTVTDQILSELNNTFITPFDREDIHALASQLDDVLDLINGSAKRTVLYHPKNMPESMTQLAVHIKEGVECIRTAVVELEKKKRNPKVVHAQCRMLHEIENTADDVYENFIISLFEKERDAIELLKQVEIIQLLESTTDKAYRVSDVLKTIMVKYA